MEPSIYKAPGPFVLETGHTLPELRIAYHTYGKPNAAHDNVVWVCHALTANSDVADWWPHTVEAGCFLDPARHFVVCANILGSHYGTTGPLHVNPETGSPYYKDFPPFTIRDIVRAHRLLAGALGIGRIDTLVGSSVGGFQAIEWAVLEPERIGKLILIATAAKASPWTIAIDQTQRMAIEADATFGQPRDDAGTPDEVMHACIGEVCTTMQEVTRIYNRTLVAVFKENRKVLKEMVQSSDKLFEEARDRKYGIMPTLRRLQQCDIDTGHFYVQVVDYLSEVTKALIHITRPAFGHIDNNHEGLSKEQIVDLMRVNDQVEAIFDKINDMLRTKDFSDLDMVLEMRDKLFDTIVEAIKNQLRRINGDPAASTRASVLYLTILNETKTMILQARNLLKSQHYFLEHKK